MNRNHVLMLGAVILMLGFQLRMVDSYVLNSTTTTFLSEKLKLGEPNTPPIATGIAQYLPISANPAPHRVIRPPRWLGWAFLSVGAVVMLHSLAMRKPGG